jgi:hypothetical protein
MKKLFLIWIFSGSLDSFSQVPDTCLPLREHSWSRTKVYRKPGFVVRQEYKDNVYLDDRKRMIKGSLVVYGYKLKK